MKVLKKGNWVRIETLPEQEQDKLWKLFFDAIKEHGSLKALVEAQEKQVNI